jgi:hypothetical protein
VFTLPMSQDPARDAFVRPRSSGALLVTLDGRVVMIAERRGERIVIRPDASAADVTKAARAVAEHLAARTARDLTVETIDGRAAALSGFADSFIAAGFKRSSGGLRFYRAV